MIEKIKKIWFSYIKGIDWGYTGLLYFACNLCALLDGYSLKDFLLITGFFILLTLITHFYIRKIKV